MVYGLMCYAFKDVYSHTLSWLGQNTIIKSILAKGQLRAPTDCYCDI